MFLLVVHIAFFVSSAAARFIVNNITVAVQTTNGPITGYVDPTTSVQIFKNVPFGADTATTRFKAPKPPPPWVEPKACIEYGNVAPQPWNQKIAGRVQSEDCLNLNLWTPALDGKKRPVLVWFHGGGYEHMTSNDPTYEGTKLASKRDVVVVTVNHRLNGFGYMYLGGVSDEFKVGNPGQADLILALQWIQDNIEKFGGNKDSVLIFGQSGGGAKCATLMAQPDAKGLFHRVWTMSGQQITGRTRFHAEQTAREVLANAGGANPVEQLSNLLKMPMEDIRKAMGGGGQKWTPLVDGISLPRDPFYPTANEQSKDIPMVIGNTYDETRSLIGSNKRNYFNLTWDAVPQTLETTVKSFIGNMSGDYIVTEYRKQYPQYSPSDVFFAASTAARSWKSMVVESDIRAKQPNSPLWVYYLRWKSPFEGGKWGAAHAFDIPLVFANSDAMKQTKGSQTADLLGEEVSKLITNFARTGEPGLGLEKEPGIPAWPRYTIEGRKSMIFDEILEIHDDDRGWERKFFEGVEYIQPGT
jgi:para-nitrobenzyl esterase